MYTIFLFIFVFLYSISLSFSFLYRSILKLVSLLFSCRRCFKVFSLRCRSIFRVSNSVPERNLLELLSKPEGFFPSVIVVFFQVQNYLLRFFFNVYFHNSQFPQFPISKIPDVYISEFTHSKYPQLKTSMIPDVYNSKFPQSIISYFPQFPVPPIVKSDLQNQTIF